MSLAQDLDGSTAPTVNAILASAESRVQGITPGMLAQEFRWAMQEFLTRTQAWRVVESVPLTPGVGRYRVPFTQTWPMLVPHVLYRASVEGVELIPTTDAEYQQLASPSQGTPKYITLEQAHVRLYPVPQAAGTLLLDVSVVIDPSVAPGVYPVSLLPHSDTILSGALSRVYAMDNRPWSSAVLARYHLGRFHNGMAMARHGQANSRSNRSARIAIPRFGV